MTETNVVEIILVDSGNYEKTLRIDNPKDELSLEEIKQAFQTPINEGWLYGKMGYPVTSVARANMVVNRKTPVL